MYVYNYHNVNMNVCLRMYVCMYYLAGKRNIVINEKTERKTQPLNNTTILAILTKRYMSMEKQNICKIYFKSLACRHVGMRVLHTNNSKRKKDKNRGKKNSRSSACFLK